MVRRYDSFVLRRWQCDGERRVDVEHLQSGGRIRNATLTAAVDWIGELCSDQGGQTAMNTGDQQCSMWAASGATGTTSTPTC
jgi:hypothetical protein